MSDDKRDRLFDLRTVERNIEHGLITREEYEEYLNSLEDTADKSLKVEASFQVGVLEDDPAQDEEE